MQTYIDNSFYQIGKDDKKLISITINMLQRNIIENFLVIIFNTIS